MGFWDYVVWPFARLLEILYNQTHNYGIAVILFAFVVNLILLPFMAKSKKSMMRTTRFQPRLKELEERHKGNQQKYQEEVMKLYREEKISPMSGCLWSLLPFPILIALYSVIRQPLERMMGLSGSQVSTITKWVTKNLNFSADGWGSYKEIGISDAIHNNWDKVVDAIGDFGGKLMDLDYSFLGINLGTIPDFKIWNYFDKGSDVLLPAIGLFLIPVIAAFLSWASMKVSQWNNPQPATGNAASSMKMMNFMMPIMSIWICFVMPAALGVYWIANSIFGMVRDFALTKHYKKKLDAEDAERLAREKEKADEIERRRLETEKLRSEGATTRNKNSSKKNVQAQQKQAQEERRAAVEKAERSAKRSRMGIEEAEVSPSQVGNRRYARGRAYDPDRFGTAFVQETDEAERIPELDETEENTEA